MRWRRCGLRGRRLEARVPHGHGKTLTSIAALRHDRVDAPRVIDGPTMSSRCWRLSCDRATSSFSTTSAAMKAGTPSATPGYVLKRAGRQFWRVLDLRRAASMRCWSVPVHRSTPESPGNRPLSLAVGMAKSGTRTGIGRPNGIRTNGACHIRPYELGHVGSRKERRIFRHSSGPEPRPDAPGLSHPTNCFYGKPDWSSGGNRGMKFSG